MKKPLKTIVIGVGAVLFFLGLSYAFVPEVLDGKIVNQGDISHYVGMSHEMTEWNDAHPDDPTYWTGSMFSGMPTAPVTVVNGGDATQPLYDALLTGRRPATYLFVALLGGFLLMLALGIDWLLAIVGAIAIGFCSYNFQIIEAGHNTKMQAIAFMPWVLAGLIWTYRVALRPASATAIDETAAPNDRFLRVARNDKRNWWIQTVLAAALFGLALSFEIKANHVQVTYYLALMIAIYAVVMLVWVLWKRRKQWKEFFIASALLLVLGLLGIGTNANKLMPINDYQPVSIRGGSELAAAGQDGGNQQAGGQKGLDLEYMTQYSYGWNELPNLFIPNWNGGGNGARTGLDPKKDEEALNKAFTEGISQEIMREGYTAAEARSLVRSEYASEIRQYSKSLAPYLNQYMYWGPQGFTKGPLYMGCITIFLFLLGLVLYDDKEKWWLLIVTVLVMVLAVGYNSDGTRYLDLQSKAVSILPMYGKFRTVNMILVLLQVALPMLAFLVLDRILKRKYTPKRFLKGLGIAAGASILFLVIGLLKGRSFVAQTDAMYLEDPAISVLADDRKALLHSDIWICLVLILAVAAVLYAFYCMPERKGMWLSEHRKPLAAGAIGLLVLINMFSVGHRYLNEDHFVTPRDFNKVYTERPVDREIKKLDPGRTARVLDLTGDTFNSAIASYHHRCIGGYSPAKLQRYADLVEVHLAEEVGIAKYYAGKAEWDVIFNEMPVVDLLNGRYVITPDGKLQENPYAYGPAWFVEETLEVDSPEDEIYALGNPAVIDPRKVAVLGLDFHGAAPASLPRTDSLDTVELLSYAPNELRYRYDAASERILVFSEIYHKDWKATVDGEPLPLFRADWILRAAVVPAGAHEIVMRFEPEVYEQGRDISRACSLPLLAIVLLAALAAILCRKKEA